jgi:MFS family permease
MSSIAAIASRGTWRTPLVILLCGCLIGVIGFGPRATLGFFLTPMSTAHDWGRDVFALAIAIQMLLWGAGQPFAGAIADRYGAGRVLIGGAILYCIGFALMAYSTTPFMLYLTAGVIIGFGLSGSSFTIVLGAFGKLMPERWRLLSFGAGAGAGSFGQFLFAPIAVGLIGAFDWQITLLIFALIVLLIVPLTPALVTPPLDAKAQGAMQQPLKHALTEAFGYRSYILLVTGFFTCGFQLFFITVHLPAFLVDQGLPAAVGGWTIAVIGLFNIFGSLFSGWLSGRMPKRYVLSLIYALRSVAIMAFILLPITPTSSLIFGAVIGFLWLSTVAPTNGLIALMFGTRWLTTLAGVAFFSHQVGGFLGVWIGGIVFETAGSYDVIWWLTILTGFVSALINLPIVEKPIPRAALPAAA